MSRAQALCDALAPSMVQRTDISQPEETAVMNMCRLVWNVKRKTSRATTKRDLDDHEQPETIFRPVLNDFKLHVDRPTTLIAAEDP